MELRYENSWNSNRWLFDRMQSILHETAAAARVIKPAVDIIEDQDSYRFYFEMPGLKTDSLDVRVENGALLIAAEGKRAEWSSEAKVHMIERPYGHIKRAFELPEDARPDQIAAAYKDGVLEVTVGKRLESKPVKVQVN